MNLIFTNSITQNILEALGSTNLWIAIVKSIAIILIGFVLTKTKLLPENTNKVLTKIVMLICLPCLAFASFMTNVTKDSFNSAIFSFVYGFIIYIIFILLSKILFLWAKDPSKRKVMGILFVFGSTTFFGQPLIKAVFPDAFNDSSMFNIAFRVFLYSYAYYVICIDNKKNITKQEQTNDIPLNENEEKNLEKEKPFSIVKKIFANPIIIATFLGFILWTLQLIGDTSDTNNWWVVTVNGVNNEPATGTFWNISISLPWLYQTINTLGSLSSPLVWIAIGCTLGKVPFKTAASDKMVWIHSLMRIILLPLINFALLFLINLIPGINVTFNTVVATTLMWAVPPSTVATTYCINTNKEATFASSCQLIATLIAVVFIPIYIILLTLVQSSNIFC